MRTTMTLSIETAPELVAVKTKRVPLTDVTTDDDVQPRVVISEDAIRRYKDALRNNRNSLPPVLLADLGAVKETWEGRRKVLTVIDGYHRFKAHEELREKSILARVIRCDPERARWLAALANMTHGLPLKRGDHREAFRRYVRAGENRKPDGGLKSYREIVGDLNGMRAVGTVYKWMQRDFPQIAAEMAERDGPLEVEEQGKPEQSYALRQLKDYCLGVTRVAKLAAKDGEESAREDLLGWSLFLTENLGQTIGIEPGRLFEVAKEAEWRSRQRFEEVGL